VKRIHPDFDPTPFQRSLRALIAGSHKYLWGSDGRNALYDLSTDPLETRSLLSEQPQLASRLEGETQKLAGSLARCEAASLDDAPGELPRGQRERLQALGYLDESVDEPNQR
jgi:hypothetical protein